MAIYLRIGPSDQRGWINITGRRAADGRFEVLIKEGVPITAPMLDVLNDLMNTETEGEQREAAADLRDRSEAVREGKR